MQQRIGGGKFSGLTCLLRFSALCVKFYGFSLRLGSRLYKFSGFSTLCKTEPPFVQPCVYSVSQSRFRADKAACKLRDQTACYWPWVPEDYFLAKRRAAMEILFAITAWHPGYKRCGFS